MAGQDMQDRPRRGRGWNILLVVSLALNLLFIGLIGGTMARFGGFGPHGAPGEARGISLGSAVFRALPREDRRAMFRQFSGSRPERGEAASDEAQDLLNTLRADALDEESLSRFAQAQADRRMQRGARMAGVWVARVSEMSVAERRAYADRVEEILTRPRKWRRGAKTASD